jgi:phenylpyruvate tautomerase PptA (4-oxalocrotonate tautomerase family)
MPYLQFDLPGAYPPETKRRLAQRVGTIYAQVMETTPAIVKVAFRELGADNLYRCGEASPSPVVVLMCDIRRGRPPRQRQAVASALATAAAEALGVAVDQVEVEFTQHSGDEMYRHGALVADWSAEEATASS